MINLAICRATLDHPELLLFHPEKGTLHDELQPSRYISEFRENAITTYAYQALVVFQPRLVRKTRLTRRKISARFLKLEF